MSAPTGTCHVCDAPTDDACVRCERSTCSDHFWDQDRLGLCDPCRAEIDADPRPVLQWPYPLRDVDPAWTGGDADLAARLRGDKS